MLCFWGEGTDLVALEEAEDVFDTGVVGEALHPDQGAVLGHHGRGMGLPCQGRCYRPRGRRKVAHCGGGHWRAGERSEGEVSIY